MEGSSMRGKISRLFAASMLPVAASGPSLTPPAPVRLEPPMLTAPAPDVTQFIPGAEALTYNSAGNALGAPLGTLRLSGTSAAFEHHQGSMTLEFAGTLPDFPGYKIASEFLAGASVYRVTNAEQYFRDNPNICGGKPLKFIVAKFESLADIQGGTMAANLWLLSLDDYADYRPSMSDPCGGDTYKAARRSDTTALRE
jgi:hypothetical protein